MKNISIIGATGYAGGELLRLLYSHPNARIKHITSQAHEGKRISEVYPHLLGLCDLILESMDDLIGIAMDSDYLFIALPHGHAMKVAMATKAMPVKIIDLGADYRFSDTMVYEKWYKLEHLDKDAKRCYGLPELYREDIKKAKIVGSAGCYTTASILALAPLAKNQLIDMNTIIVDAKSGVSGAGRSPSESNHFPELYDSFKAYGAVNHRHTPEIEQAMTDLSGENTVISFTPHLVPMSRGILATAYANLKNGVTSDMVDKVYHQQYDEEYFVRIVGEGHYPTTKAVRGSNYVDIAWHIDNRTGRIIVMAAIDNLVKGAAGQAVQNFNISAGLAEHTGLKLAPLYP